MSLFLRLGLRIIKDQFHFIRAVLKRKEGTENETRPPCLATICTKQRKKNSIDSLNVHPPLISVWIHGSFFPINNWTPCRLLLGWLNETVKSRVDVSSKLGIGVQKAIYNAREERTVANEPCSMGVSWGGLRGDSTSVCEGLPFYFSSRNRRRRCSLASVPKISNWPFNSWIIIDYFAVTMNTHSKSYLFVQSTNEYKYISRLILLSFF